MESYRILAVGNSFSEDAFAYLHDLAAAGGSELTTVNLYIGGCNLERHWNNILGRRPDYLYELNGISTGRKVSSCEVLESEHFDVILTQQASHDSGIAESYEPYLGQIQSYFASLQPAARRVLMKTWAYETDSSHDCFPRYGCDQQLMYQRLTECYESAAAAHGLHLVPCGTVVQNLRSRPPFRYSMGEHSLCRDGFHMDLIYGRYLLAATIYADLFGGDLRSNRFLPKGADPAILEVIKNAILELI